MDSEELEGILYSELLPLPQSSNPVGNFIAEFVKELVAEICTHLSVAETQILLSLVTYRVPDSTVRAQETH